MTSPPRNPRSILLLGAGELGKEIAISAQRLGVRVVAADRYGGAPAMAVSHASEVLSLVDAVALKGVVRTHEPDLILPEVESIGTETLRELEADGFRVVPSAAAAGLARTRDAIRDLARDELGLRTPRYTYASTEEELTDACDHLGYPCVVKPVESVLGRGQTVVPGPARVERAWDYAHEGSGGDPLRVLVEEHIDFREEVTLLTVREWDGGTTFCDPIAHRQDRGGYRESWVPAEVTPSEVAEMQRMARLVTDRLAGAGVFGIEFFLTGDEVIFSEVSLGPHDTGMVTMISQDLSQFDLHVRAVLNLPLPRTETLGPSASAVILADREGLVAGYRGIDRALQVEGVRLRIFGKPTAHLHRRMGVALARGSSAAEARSRALEAAARISLVYA